MWVDLGAQKLNRSPEVFHSVETVFDGDPGLESDGLKRGKNPIVIVHALPNYAVRQTSGIPGRVLLLAQVLDGSVLQKTIAGMHRNDPLFEAIEQRQRILPGQNRVGGIIVNAEPR